MITLIKNNIYLVLCIVLLTSCSMQKDTCLMGQEKGIVSTEYKNKVIESIDENINVVLDSIIRVNVFKNQFISLSYNNNIWTITISQKIKLVDMFDLFNKKEDYILFFKGEPIFVNPIDSNIFNQIFSKTNIDTLLLFGTYQSYNTETNIVYFSEQYKENKEFVPAFCKYQFMIIDNKIVDFVSNCDSLFFNTKEELEELYEK